MKPLIPNGILVHHTATAGYGKQFALIEADYRKHGAERSTFGYYGPYHYLIEKDGKVEQAASETEQRPHSTSTMHWAIGIALAGNFSVEQPTARQRNALVGLIGEILARHKIGDAPIYPHRAYSATQCYGTNLADDWAAKQYAHRRTLDLWDAFWQIKATFEIIYAKVTGRQFA